MYEGTQARVITPDGETEFFSILAGVLHGDTLAPYLFAIIFDYVVRKAIGGKEEELGFTLHHRRSRRHEPVIMTDTDFADHIATISEEMEQAQNMLTNIDTLKHTQIICRFLLKFCLSVYDIICGAGDKGVKDANINFFLDKFHIDALLLCFFD